MYNLSEKLKDWVSSLDNTDNKNENSFYEEAIKGIFLNSGLYFPFLEKFFIIAKVSLDDLLDDKDFYKNVSIYLLQSIYFLIRNLQKLLS